MKKGIKIGISLLALGGIGTMVYFMFVKKDSKFYVLKSNLGNGIGSTPTPIPTTTTPTPTSPISTPTPTPVFSGCEYPTTPFSNRTEGDKFRSWVHSNYKSVANAIDLDLSSPFYNNCAYMRKAFAHKVSGGRTLGSLYQGAASSSISDESTSSGTELLWAQFKNRMTSQGIKKSVFDNYVLVKLKSSRVGLTSHSYRMSYWENGTWMLKMQKGSADAVVIARGTYNIDSRWNSGTVTRVTFGKELDSDSMIGDNYTAISKIIWGAQRVIKKYWSSYDGVGMSNADASSILPYT